MVATAAATTTTASEAPAGSGDMAAARRMAAYSELQKARLTWQPPQPAVLTAPACVPKSRPAAPAAGNADVVQELFPLTFGQQGVELAATEGSAPPPHKSLNVGVVLSGGQAPGGHNVISGIFDYLQTHAPGSTLFGFRNGPAGIINGDVVVIDAEFLHPFRNQGGFDIICSGRTKIETDEQFAKSLETVKRLKLDGLVVIGGDDSNTNAAMLAEYFMKHKADTHVIGCPKTIDGDLKNEEVETSFGFDTACKIYSESIGNVMVDARSAGKYYHFVRLMGRAASHITLECALQTHPNAAIIGEEIAANKNTLGDVTRSIADMVTKRAEAGRNYGVVLIPEGLIDFIPEVNKLIAELNDILANGPPDSEGKWKSQLTEQSRDLFEFLPRDIAAQLLLDRDPHGNVQVAKIETEKLLIELVAEELDKRKQAGQFKGKFSGQAHFFGYEGRCGLPTNFDATYCYALGQTAGALLQYNYTGLIASVRNLTAAPEQWSVGGTPLTSMILVERRKGKNKPVIKKALVELEGRPFEMFKLVRDKWAVLDMYRAPGPIQFQGPGADGSNFTLLLEQQSGEAQARFELMAKF
eukprot:jgi/Chlat1/4942/Chrsp31S04849